VSGLLLLFGVQGFEGKFNVYVHTSPGYRFPEISIHAHSRQRKYVSEKVCAEHHPLGAPHLGPTCSALALHGPLETLSAAPLPRRKCPKQDSSAVACCGSAGPVGSPQ